ncbi:MAG: lysophospholipid acyltransferase family protein [Candidatus Edwardsbacteria bacterium]|nr:lysophospholipid acyltransferase family protein [Candidatus Edwardsbacteria bacterium]
MKKAGYIIQYRLLCLIGWWANLLPLNAALGFGAALGSFGYFLGMRKNVALENLRQSFPEKPEIERTGIAEALYRNLGKNLIELLRFKNRTPSDIRATVAFDGEEHFKTVLARGRGAILVSGHFGNWEMYAAAIASAGYPFSVVVYPQHNVWVDGMLNRLRQDKGIEIIYKRNAAKDVLRALKANRLVTMLSDQDAGSDGVFVEFFGRPASTTRGPALFACKTGVPIITGVIVREPDGKHRGIINPPLYADQSADREQEIKRLTQQFTAILEGFVRQYSDHWYWVHKRWKTKPKRANGQREKETP